MANPHPVSLDCPRRGQATMSRPTILHKMRRLDQDFVPPLDYSGSRPSWYTRVCCMRFAAVTRPPLPDSWVSGMTFDGAGQVPDSDELPSRCRNRLRRMEAVIATLIDPGDHASWASTASSGSRLATMVERSGASPPHRGTLGTPIPSLYCMNNSPFSSGESRALVMQNIPAPATVVE